MDVFIRNEENNIRIALPDVDENHCLLKVKDNKVNIFAKFHLKSLSLLVHPIL